MCFSRDRRLHAVATYCQRGVKALPGGRRPAGVHGAGLAGAGQAEGQSLERLSSDHQITDFPSGPAPRPDSAHGRATKPHPPDCETSKALHHHVTPPTPPTHTHTGWYYYHVKVRFTSKHPHTHVCKQLLPACTRCKQHRPRRNKRIITAAAARHDPQPHLYFLLQVL